jgi:hypothetical protein
MIDYDPIAPTSIQDANLVLEEEIAETRRKSSLMELAGIEGGEPEKRARRSRPERAPERIERVQAEEAEFDDALPENFAAEKPVLATDEDFFKMIEDDVDHKPAK